VAARLSENPLNTVLLLEAGEQQEVQNDVPGI
jgi:choline dehydrogenase-like flavoprotein